MKVDIRTEWWKVKEGSFIAFECAGGSFWFGRVEAVEPRTYEGSLPIEIERDDWIDSDETPYVYIQEPEVMQVLKEELLK
jgi:hypothetical protein